MASTYTIQPGDTLSGIANKFGTSVSALQQLNSIIVNPNYIQAGWVLHLPGSTPAPTPAPTSNVWAAIPLSAVQFTRVAEYSCTQVIKDVCAAEGLSTQFWLPGGLTVALRESSYASNAINNYDLNAHGPIVADGYPEYCSRGAWQFIAPTFASYHRPGTSNNIYDGHALFSAFINYTRHVYGVNTSGSNLAANVQQADPNRSPRGY